MSAPAEHRVRTPKGYDGFLHVGVAGSRHGASQTQMRWLKSLVSLLPVERICLHQGDCIGFDQEAWEFFAALGVPMIVTHPPVASTFRAFMPLRKGYPDVLLPQKQYTERDIDIIVAARILFAAPNLPMKESPRSGTWFTVRRGWGRGIPVFVLPRGES